MAGVPYVITTLLEDVPTFHYQSHFVASIVQQYVDAGQNRSWWQKNQPAYHAIEKAPAFDNRWAAQNAAALYPNGATEAETIARTYGAENNLTEIKLGYDLGVEGNAERFLAEFGVKDFVLCVGRVESRKNQLMLLKALEDDDITVVLASGGFSYQPEYLEAVQKFNRKGKTILLPKLTNQQLADCYAAAKVHVLPSWYELPGLVSLEAAYYGCNIVATKNGTAKDYLGSHAFYCDPGNEDSIRSAVLAAVYAPKNTNLKEMVMTYSWKEMADKTFESYREVSGWIQTTEEASTQSVQPIEDVVVSTTEPTRAPVATPATATVLVDADPARYHEFLEKGELLAKNQQYDEALAAFTEAESSGSATTRLVRARGATLLAANRPAEAIPAFERAISLDPKDYKSFCGIGMSRALLDDKVGAYEAYIESLTINPDHPVAILQLMQVAYSLNRYEDLEKTLRWYMQTYPADLEMTFCLAGCLYKQNLLPEAQTINEGILSKNNAHTGALELKKLLETTTPEVSVSPLRAELEVERAPQSRSDLSSVSNEFNVIDQELIAIEDCKRRAKYEEALSRIAAISIDQNLSFAQQETVQCQRAEILVLTDRYYDASQSYSAILEANPDCARAMCGEAALSASRGDWETARRKFITALDRRPEYDVALAGLGLYESQAKNLTAAWDLYTRALKSNPENIRALLGSIETGYSLQKLTDVEAVIRNYLDVHPADIDFMYSLAGCCFAQGKVMDAVEAINTITLFEPNHKNALELRQMIEKQEQQSDSARV